MGVPDSTIPDSTRFSTYISILLGWSY